MKRIIMPWVAGLFIALPMSAQKVIYQTDRETGSLQYISIAGDEHEMNWILRTDGTQYPWVTSEYGWGLGFFSIEDKQYQWKQPVSQSEEKIIYKVGDITVSVRRNVAEDDVEETYCFTNEAKRSLRLEEIGIHVPFNDNYPDATTCMTSRCNVHIWTGGSTTYANAIRMSGAGPHLGLVLTEGNIRGYEVKKRSRETGQSNFRGIITFDLEDMILKPKESYTLSWRIFAHNGWKDFTQKLLALGGVVVQTDKYVYEQGENATVTFITRQGEKKLHPSTTRLGHQEILFSYGKGKQTKAEILVVSRYENLLKQRADFIVHHQQLQNKNDKRHGAYLVYDNEEDSIYLNDTPNCNPVDRDEGRERVGMGVFLARMYQRYSGEELRKSLVEYASFVRRLQDKEYNTYSNTDLKGWNRNYNYSWIATFYFEMFRVTSDKQFLKDGYYTLKALYRNFGHGFYAIDMPVQGYTLLKENGFEKEAESLKEDFKLVADAYVKNGYHYPKSEVNYEQSIVAPSIIHLLRIYKLTGDQKYLDGAKEQLPLLEAFGGFQPSYHLNDISIRHWDGYWFGKREFWGDTFPHYWSTLTAVAYDLYGQCTGDISYRQRARNILLGNLCLFTEEGRGSCAYVYPYKVDGKRAQFYDPYANDQDWAMCFYLEVLN